MSLLESSWFLVSFLVISIVLLLDPKTSLTDSNTNGVLGLFSSPSWVSPGASVEKNEQSEGNNVGLD